MRRFTLNRVFIAYVAFFLLVVLGIIPRWTVLGAAALLVIWMCLAALEEGVLFFVRSIPLFIAIPLTTTYDNLTLWRPLALVLTARFLLERSTWRMLSEQLSAMRHNWQQWCRKHRMFLAIMALVVLAGLSLFGSAYPRIGVTRLIYFVNLSLVPFILFSLLRQNRLKVGQLITNLAIPTAIAIVVGYLQLASTYLMDVYQFMRLWGEGIQLRQFGQQWSYIATWVGNTWLAYYGPQLSLRVFSLFPDSHSFPTFLLLGLPTLFAISFDPILKVIREVPLKRLVRTYASMKVLWIPAAFLIMILSGTRGIWAASVGVVGLAIILVWYFRRQAVDIVRRRVFSYVALYLTVFFMLFALAWPIFISPQFLLGKGDLSMFANRIRSVIDFGETSNALRLAIWKSSIHSIVAHPLLGVGIGNFPVVLDQKIALARAGSSAHNLYLHVAAEMGIPAAAVMIAILVAVWLRILAWFKTASGREVVYAAALLLLLPWVYAYVLTDPIIFDERVFLIFASTMAIIWSQRTTPDHV